MPQTVYLMSGSNSINSLLTHEIQPRRCKLANKMPFDAEFISCLQTSKLF